MMGPSELARRFYEVLGGGALEELERLLAPGFESGVPGLPAGEGPYRAMLAQQRAAFSDFRTEVRAVVEEGGCVAVLTTTSGRHTGAFLGHPPSGATFEAKGADVLWIEDGRIVRRDGAFDALGMLQQLGLYRATDVAPG